VLFQGPQKVRWLRNALEWSACLRAASSESGT
jgi:hypothetical protein